MSHFMKDVMGSKQSAKLVCGNFDSTKLVAVKSAPRNTDPSKGVLWNVAWRSLVASKFDAPSEHEVKTDSEKSPPPKRPPEKSQPSKIPPERSAPVKSVF